MSPNAPFFTAESRLLLIAPHPDDESLACSVILQRAVSAGARIRVVYATDGDNNPWPQRATERKWRLTKSDRARWGQLRRTEALRALALLGVAPADVEFLGLPDQGLTELLVSGCRQTVHRLGQIIANWTPTDVFVPDIGDTHPDHSALGLIIRRLFDTLPTQSRPDLSLWTFLVHGNSPTFFSRATTVPQTAREIATKMAAITCHDTQLKLSRRRFMHYALRLERFVACDHSPQRHQFGQLWNTRRPTGEFVITLPAAPRRLLPRRPKLFLFGYGPSGDPVSVCLTIDRRAKWQAMIDCATGACVARVETEGNLLRGMQVAVPQHIFSLDRALYLKLERRRVFFDETGWVEFCASPAVADTSTAELPAELSLALT